MDLWDERFAYVDRITEIEGYAVAVEEGRRKIQELYESKGFARAQVEILEGNKPQDQGVVT